MALVAFFRAATGLAAANVLNERNAGPRPSSTFLSFQLATQDGTPHPAVDLNTTTLAQTVEDQTYLTYAVNVYGAGAIGLINKIRLRSYGQTFDILLAEHVGHCGFGQIIDSSTDFNGTMLVQASTQWTLCAVLAEDLTADYFATAILDVTASDTETITVEGPGAQ